MQAGVTAQGYSRWQTLVTAALVFLSVSPCFAASPQRIGASKETVGNNPLDRAPRSWVTDAAAKELVALHHKNSYLRYRMHSVNDKGDRVRDVIESKDGTVARLILIDGKPLTDQQDKEERERLADLLASPSAYARHVKNNESDKKMADRLVPLLPEAGLFQYTPGQPQTGTNHGGLEVVIDYMPDPKFVPPDMEAQALTGLEGRVWIDAKSRYVVRMEGIISHKVNFGWGMLAHIYPGGTLVLNQTGAAEDRWIFTDFAMHLTVRALMVKTLKVDSHVQTSNYKTLAPMSYQSAIRMLLNTPLPAQ